MIKISKMADYAVVILAAMAAEPTALMSAWTLSEKTKLPEPTVSKILKMLARGEIIKSTRGMNGGYILMKPASEISVARIVQAIDGPITITACADGVTPDCGLASNCSVRGRWDDVNLAIRDALESVSLADMAHRCGKTAYEKEAAYGRH